MQNNYLIPANTKKSQYIFGFFTKLDLIVLGIGVGFSSIMIFTIKSMSVLILVLLILPALISGFLVMPVPHYHNVLQLLTNVFNFYTGRRQYYWKGWSKDEEFTRNSNKF